MIPMILTQSSGILKPIAVFLGWIMNGIFVLLSKAGINNIALTIIVFTLVIYACLTPLTYKQQKFSKMTQIMNPELQAVQKKYKGKRDQVSVQKMNEETQAIYRKYGVSPSGSCVYMIIQLPILFALYRVIYNVPAYISSVKNVFSDLVTGIMGTAGYQNTFQAFFDEIKSSYIMRTVSLNFESDSTAFNSIIDVLYKCNDTNWAAVSKLFPDLSTLFTSTQTTIDELNRFLGVSIVYSPRYIITNAFSEGKFLLILIAILIPIISAATQFLNIRLMPQPAVDNGNGMGGQMKMMNYMMPIYSLVLVFFLPVGVGLYWIMGALIRCVQQVYFNHRLDKMDMDAMIKANMEKAEQKAKQQMQKSGVSSSVIQSAGKIQTKKISNAGGTIRSDSMAAKAATAKATVSKAEAAAADAEKAAESSETVAYRKGSLTDIARRVDDYNNKNTRR